MKSSSSFSIDSYTYTGSLAPAATYIPANKTIVMTAWLDSVGDLIITYDGDPIEQPATKGTKGTIRCEGTLTGFKNDHIAAHNLALYGVTV